ncbi:MAG TPA: hypothetical protein VLR49_03850 [Ferruginibacter sp.]|nr:hypothetical protein [Ferruginibacter sp.]
MANQTNILQSMLPITAMMKKNQELFFKKTTRSSNYPIAYAANHSDDGEKLKH